MRRLIKFTILFIIIGCVIISLNKNNNDSINYKYAFLVSSAFKPNYNSKIVLVDEKKETKKEVVLDKNIYNVLYVDDEGKIYAFPTDRTYRYEYDYKNNILNKIENPKTNKNNLCQGRVDSIIETNKGPAFIINVGLKENDSYYHYVLVDNECYELGVYYNQGAYDFDKNLLYIDGYQMFNDATNFKSYAIDLETKKINKKDYNDKFINKIDATDYEGVIKNNYLYNNVKQEESYLIKLNLNNYEIDKKIKTSLTNNKMTHFMYDDNYIYYIKYDGNKSFLETYDYDLNIISSDLIDDNNNNLLVHRILVFNNKLYYYTPVGKDGNIYEYDITNKKIISKFNPNIKFNEGQLVTSIGINKNN